MNELPEMYFEIPAEIADYAKKEVLSAFPPRVYKPYTYENEYLLFKE